MGGRLVRRTMRIADPGMRRRADVADRANPRSFDRGRKARLAAL